MRLLLATALIAIVVPATAAAPGWTGRYSFENGLGRNAGGTYMSIEHNLVIGPRSCRLTASGYQTDTDIICRANGAGGTLTVNFVSNGDGRIANQYGVIQYRPGQTLFTLTRSPRGLVTRWGAYKPDATRGAGNYFRRG